MIPSVAFGSVIGLLEILGNECPRSDRLQLSLLVTSRFVSASKEERNICSCRNDHESIE